MPRHIMVDLETWGQAPGCSIVSIGAVEFGAGGVAADGFYTAVSRQSCRFHGLHEDPSTIEWWRGQPAAAKAALADAEDGSAPSLSEALDAFTAWLGADADALRDIRLWGNGSDFDNAILACAYRALGRSTPWRYGGNRCFRTLKSLGPSIELSRNGVHHRALDDARWQARCAVIIMNNLDLEWDR